MTNAVIGRGVRWITRREEARRSAAHDFLKQMMIGVFPNFLFDPIFKEGTSNNKKANSKPVAY